MLICVYAVTGMSYPSHNEPSYNVSQGACKPSYYRGVSYKVSAVTCRHLCDAARRPFCHGFTYFPPRPEDAQLGATVSTCRLLRGTCRPSKSPKSKSYTYFREENSTSKAHLGLLTATPVPQLPVVDLITVNTAHSSVP